MKVTVEFKRYVKAAVLVFVDIYDGTATYSGGTIIINGSQVDSIPQSSMMGGGFGGGFGGGRGGRF